MDEGTVSKKRKGKVGEETDTDDGDTKDNDEMEDCLSNSLDENEKNLKNTADDSNDKSDDGRCLRRRTKQKTIAENDLSEKDDQSSDIEDKTDSKRKRGRPPGRKPGKQKKNSDFGKLPDAVTEGLDDDLKEQLQYGYILYLVIASNSRNSPFVEKPNSCLFGMSSYFTLIKKPMWLKEIKRKLFEKEYNSLYEVVEDFRIMIENCYKFWGPDHRLSEKAFRIEYKLLQKINSLPEPFREMGKEGFGKDDCMDESEDKGSTKDEDKNENFPDKNYQSIILKRILNWDENENGNEIDEVKDKVMISWENKCLVTQEKKTEINSMWQLPAIGMFIKLTHETLYTKEIHQYEIERMLLMPRESVTLATLMTTLLSPAVDRPKLEASVPIMPYEIWNEKLQKKVQEWFAIFYKNGDEKETFEICGIEPLFWGSMCILNPYDDKDFHELTFFQRAWILKSLCDHVYHTNKSVQELFPDELAGSSAREVQLGIYNNYMYFYIPFWPDIRIYRQRIISSKIWNTVKDIGITTGKLLQQSLSTSYEDGVQHPRIEDFCLVAESYNDLLALIEETKEVNPEMCRKIKNFSEDAKLYPPNYESLRNLYDQWHEYQTRSEDYYKSSIKYWKAEKVPFCPDSARSIESEVLGKRQRKVTNTFSLNMTSSESECDIFEGMDDDEGSDWECPSEKKKAKKQTKPQSLFDSFDDPSENKKKRAPKKRNEECNVKKPTTAKKKEKTVLFVNNSSEPDDKISLKITGTQSIRENPDSEPVNCFSLSQDVVIKKEKEELNMNNTSEIQIKQEINEIQIKEEVFDKNEKTSEPNKVENQVSSESAKEPPVTNVVKQETKDDIISLSSSDDDDDVVLTTPKKNFPVPKILPSPPPPAPRPNLSPRTVRSPVRPQMPQVRTPRMPIQPTRSPTISPQTPRTPMTPTRFAQSPRTASPRQSPRMNTPIRNFSPTNSPRMQNSSARANLFPTTPPRNQQGQPSNTVPAKVSIGTRDDGSLGYIARLTDGGVIHLSRLEVDAIRRKHNGTIPPVVQIPLKPRFY